MSHFGSGGGLITMLVPLLIVGGALIWLWMLPGVRVHFRKAHGRLHRYFYGPLDGETDSPAADSTGGADANGASGAGGDAVGSSSAEDPEKEHFDYSIFQS